MRGKIGDKERLGHILDAITEIEAYTANIGLKDFLANSMMRFASIKQIEIIGEAANYITPRLRHSLLKSNGNRSSECDIFSFMNTSASTKALFGR